MKVNWELAISLMLIGGIDMLTLSYLSIFGYMNMIYINTLFIIIGAIMIIYLVKKNIPIINKENEDDEIRRVMKHIS